MPVPSSTTTHLENYSTLADTFLEFLTVAIHLILYERDIYPHRSFLRARKYNYPVRQNRHPAVCKFIDDAVGAVRVQVMKCTVSSVSVILISPEQIPLERYVFSIVSFPIVGAKEHLIPFVLAPKDPPPPPPPASDAAAPTAATTAQVRLPSSYTHISDLHAQYTAVLERLGTCSSSMKPLPKDSSFTLAIEMRQTPRGEPPIGWPMPFVPAEPGLQRGGGMDEASIWTVARPDGESELGTTQETSSGLWSSSGDTVSLKGKGKTKSEMRGRGEEVEGQENEQDQGVKRSLGKHLGGMRAVPIRNVEAGPFMMEVWVEQNDDANREERGSGYKSASVEDE